MEQESQGLMSLNPMFFWQFVMPKSTHLIPKVVCVDYKISREKLIALANKYRDVDFIIENKCATGESSVILNNVGYRWRDRMEYRHWLESWTGIDYVIAQKENLEDWIQPALCGVKILFSEDELPEIIYPFDSVSRIENWEWAKEVLTKEK